MFTSTSTHSLELPPGTPVWVLGPCFTGLQLPVWSSLTFAANTQFAPHALHIHKSPWAYRHGLSDCLTSWPLLKVILLLIGWSSLKFVSRWYMHTLPPCPSSGKIQILALAAASTKHMGCYPWSHSSCYR